MKIKQVKGNTFYIDTGSSNIPFYKINDEEVILLDSGLAKREGEGLDEILEKNNIKVSAIICTHAHVDHIGNNRYLKDKYNCIISMSDYEAHICSSVVNLKPYYIGQTISEVNKNFGHIVCKTDMIISNDEEIVNICGINFKILHTPGHSPGHICIITPDEVAYLGDALISFEVMRVAKLPYSYIIKDDLKSKLKLCDLKCSNYIVAHKGVYDNITELIVSNINFYKDKAKMIYDLIDYPMTMNEILKAVIKKFNISVNNKERYSLIERILRSYVEYLNEMEMIKLSLDDGCLKYSKNN